MKTLFTNNLSPTDLKVANYIDANINNIDLLTIDSICNELYISKSAITKYCQKIGYSGFRELKFDAKNITSNTNNSSSIQDYQEQIDKFFKRIGEDTYLEVAKEIMSAEKIIVFGQSQSYHAGELLANKLRITVSKNAIAINDMQHLEIESNQKDCLVIIISASISTNPVIEAIVNMHRKQAKVMMISEDTNIKMSKFVYKNIVLGNDIDYQKTDIRPRINIYIFIELLIIYLKSIELGK